MLSWPQRSMCSKLGQRNSPEITRVGKRDSHTATGLTHSQHSEHNAHSDRIDTQSIHNNSNFAHSDRIDTQSTPNLVHMTLSTVSLLIIRKSVFSLVLQMASNCYSFGRSTPNFAETTQMTIYKECITLFGGQL